MSWPPGQAQHAELQEELPVDKPPPTRLGVLLHQQIFTELRSQGEKQAQALVFLRGAIQLLPGTHRVPVEPSLP